MAGLLETAAIALSGGGGAMLLQVGIAWLKSRGETHRDDRSADARLEEHRDQLTFDLLEAARSEMAQIREEVVALRPISMRVVHLEEALDHLYALLHAEAGVEWEAASRRAASFLRRMRPAVGDLRNAAQTAVSAKRVAGDVEGKPQ